MSSLHVCMVIINISKCNFVETPRKFIIAKLSICKLGYSALFIPVRFDVVDLTVKVLREGAFYYMYLMPSNTPHCNANCCNIICTISYSAAPRALYLIKHELRVF